MPLPEWNSTIIIQDKDDWRVRWIQYELEGSIHFMGVVENTLEMMDDRRAARLSAAISWMG